MSTASAVLLAGIAGLTGTEARADTTPARPTRQLSSTAPVGLSVGIGLGLALVPMAVGGGLAARSSDARTRRLALEILAGGLALAPVVSHLVAAEGYRATVFGSVTLSAFVLAASLLETVDGILDDTKKPACVVLGGALATLLVTSGYGLVDSLMAGERTRPTFSARAGPDGGQGLAGAGPQGSALTMGPSAGGTRRPVLLVLLLVTGAAGLGCAVVPRHQRARLADPIMRLDQDSLEAHKKSKFYGARSGAAGGDGVSAGGGCSCQ